MGIKYFGQFLLERNVINAGQLLDAVMLQESKNLKFGEYAKAKGFLTDGDIERIHEEQKRTDMMMGEFAVQLGMMTKEQVDEVLTLQKNDHVLIGVALVKLGHLSPEKLGRELENFKQDQNQYVSEDFIMPEGVKNPDVVRHMVSLTKKMLRRVAFIEAKIDWGVVSDREPDKNYCFVGLDLTGAGNYSYMVSAPLEVAKSIAAGVVGDDCELEGDEIIIDGVKEFCNIVCGNVLAWLAQRGKSCELTPPRIYQYADGKGYSAFAGRKAACFPLISATGDMYLYLIEG